MTGFEMLRLLLIFVVLFNPIGFGLLALDLTAYERDRSVARRLVVTTAFASVVLCALAALLGEQLLDWLDISVSSFQIATGVLLVLSALTMFLGDRGYGEVRAEDRTWVAARLVLWLASPAAVAAAIAYAADRGVWSVIIVLLVSLLTTAALAIIAMDRIAGGARRAVAEWTSRGLAAILVVIAIDLIRQGVENV